MKHTPKERAERAAYERARYRKNRQTILAKQRERWANDPEFRARHAQYKQDWVERNREQVNAYHRQYYRDHHAERLAYLREYYKRKK